MFLGYFWSSQNLQKRKQKRRPLRFQILFWFVLIVCSDLFLFLDSLFLGYYSTWITDFQIFSTFGAHKISDFRFQIFSTIVICLFVDKHVKTKTKTSKISIFNAKSSNNSRIYSTLTIFILNSIFNSNYFTGIFNLFFM